MALNGGIAWLARNPVAANLLMVLIVAAGLMAATEIVDEPFPQADLDVIGIDVPYLGAAPEDVETGVVLRVEEAVQNIQGIRQILSTASPGSASVWLDLELGADSRRVLDEVTTAVQGITTFPAATEEPIIRKPIVRNQVLVIAISGAVDAATLKSIAEQVRGELLTLPEVSQVDVAGVPPYEISIEVSEGALRAYQLTFDDVTNAVRRSSIDIPGGSVRSERGDVLLRTIGQAYRGTEYENLVLLARPDGTRLLLGDVATVVDGFAETEQLARFDRAPAVMLYVFRSGSQSTTEASAAVHGYIDRVRPRLPAGVALTIWRDQSLAIDDRLAIMLRNGAAGLVLVLVVLTLSLEIRLAFWVSLGIPIAFLGAIALMPGLGVSMNMVSSFAFLLVLGIVVDDAIIVGENIYRHQREEGDGLRGAVEGAREICRPVVFAVLTTVVAFLPLLFVPGIAGEMFGVIPLVVVPCLLFSLLESLGILPAHLAHTRRRRAAGSWHRFQQRIADGLVWTARSVYEPILEVALRWRYVTAAIGIATLTLTAALVLSGRLSFRFFPSVEAEFINAAVTMPLGTPIEATLQAVAKFEAGATRLRARLEEETGLDHFRHVATIVGDQPVMAGSGSPTGRMDSPADAPHLAEVTVELVSPEYRSYTSEELGILWREQIGPVPEVDSVVIIASLMTSSESVDVELAGRDLDALRSAAAALAGRLAEYAGVYEIADSFRTARPEMRLDIRPAAESLGLRRQDLGRQVRQAFYGEEAQRIQRGRDEIRVMVRYPRDDRQSLGNLENMRIRTPDGGQVPFGEVARLEAARGLTSIARVDGNRIVDVTASVDPQVSSASEIVADLRERVLPDVLADFPGVHHSFEGGQAEQQDTMGALVTGFVLALIAIFGLLAIPLRSYIQPLIVMGAIPFAFVGALWGHLLLGIALSFTSMFGFVALTGVVVNDSLIMVDFINRARVQPSGASLAQAIREAGSRRFRPILLTSLTTFVGLGPMMLDRSLQASLFVPMAVSLAFGVLFATLVTLFLVPTSYLILDDLQRLPGRLSASFAPGAGRAPRAPDRSRPGPVA
ncbi:MAG: efflux RND transporter permease subunit [Acidobacteria bacterium]|nr:efflux RND transporter permease subunit [Acidobacteriota bacterium]